VKVQHSIPERFVERVAHRLAVLGQPLRIRIVERLQLEGEMCVQELADALDATQQNVSRHLGLLYEDRIVDRRPDGRMVRYCVVDEAALTLLDDAGTQVATALRKLGGSDEDDEI
jgi:ArsR family transcriptional regulator